MSNQKLEVIADPVEPTIVTHRTVRARRALVFECFTNVEHMKHWLGPRNMTMVDAESDLRPGGKWRFTHRTPEGQDFRFHGEYREISPPDRVVRTFVYEGWPDAEALETVFLEEHDGLTTITTTTVHKTMEARDGHLNAGMARGMTEGYERLDELLLEIQAK